MTNFDLFRLNCFLNDTKANDFKKIIISLVCEYIYENDNNEVSLDAVYKHILNFHKLDVEFDYFTAVIENYEAIEKIPLQNNILLKLTSKKFADINSQIKEHSIDVYIENFLHKNSYPHNLHEPIKSLLYQAVYENISTFSTANLSELLSPQLKNNFKNSEIEAFNQFLDDKDHEKNGAVYNVFLKAIEFAIITSGKGIKEFSKDMFDGKTYCLDTNILFRILGIGGVERQNTLINLIKSCKHQGIIFEYTPQTLGELKRTLTASVRFLKAAEAKQDIIALGELTESDPQIFNEDFVLHYSKLRHKGLANSPDQYELKLLSDFRTLENQLGFGLRKGEILIDEREQSKLATHLFKSKKENQYSSRYTATAASIDAANIMYVRKLRGDNNYNYADVKSFYLSTDRSLNAILSKDKGVKIPETILPSQLYILHHPYTSNGEEVDYELFLQFVKRRTTEFHFKGSEVLTYINTIRRQTTSKTELRTILQVYADVRYDNVDDPNVDERKVKPLQEVIDTIIDKKLNEGKRDKEELSSIKERAYREIPSIFKNTRFVIRILDIVLTIAIIPVTLVIAKNFVKDYRILILITLVVEAVKFLITSKTRLWNNTWELLMENRLINSAYYKLSNDKTFLKNGLDKVTILDGEIWKKDKTTANGH